HGRGRPHARAHRAAHRHRTLRRVGGGRVRTDRRPQVLVRVARAVADHPRGLLRGVRSPRPLRPNLPRQRREAVTAFAARRFWPILAGIVAVGAAVRSAYIYTDDRLLIGGDGFDYHFSAIRLADGLGYTSAVGDVSAPTAHHPPGWVTLLGGVSWLGFDSI